MRRNVFSLNMKIYLLLEYFIYIFLFIFIIRDLIIFIKSLVGDRLC